MVQLKPIAVARYQGDRWSSATGSPQGDIVVTAGVQKLFPGKRFG